uniref:Rho guanine nucleotide exchange factor 15b n=1 Tax=Amphilophus citrinellus TaxID=61819 RepID=A0A3Q0S8T3_AMPCI
MEDVGQEDGGGEHDDSDGVEQRAEDEVEWEVGEAECGDEVDSDAGDTEETFAIEEVEVPKQEKAKFHETLNAVIADGQRRRSDPGPHAVLTSLAVTLSESPPIPPKRTQSPQIHQGTVQNEDENIYEATLPTICLTPEKRVECKEQDIPVIRVRKPACQTRQTSSLSDPTSEFLNGAEPISSPEDVPPPIPERKPFSKDSRSLTPLAWGGVPLVLPAMDEGRFLQPSSPSGSTGTRLSPQRANTPPPQLIPPHRPSMFEVLTSEASYLRSLRVLTEHFMESRELEETMIIRDRKTLFSNILRIREVSERFLKDLEDRIFKDLVFADICDIIHYHAQHNFPAYIDYVRNQIYQEKIFSEKNNTQFNAVITRLQESHHCQRLPFVSFLLLPFQRITRIKICLLFQNILKRTKEGTKEEQTASKALTSVSKCNTEVGKMKQMEELIHISKTLEFDKLKAIPIISQTRFLEKKGELQEMSRGGTLFNMRAKFNPVYFFLFNDLLVITRFVVLDHAHRSLVQVQPAEESGSSGGPYEHCFSLTLLENHQGRMLERLIKLYCAWMSDCPQVQCVEQYIAQQADELNLEPTEIINIIRKTNEGWYEGTRLSDGQKGWFPVMNVIEITNEHVRRRNLRERYRVMQAAAFVANSKTRTLQ